MAIFPENLNVDVINANWLPKLDKSFGLKVISIEGDKLSAEMKVTEALLQPFGLMHGGVSCVLGESLGSVAGGMSLKDPNLTVVGQSLYALHLRPVHLGMTLLAEATPQHVGRRSQIWDILLQDKETRKPTAKITLTLAVIEKPDTKKK
jgi:1,4-dihydroxy-2-naphthoyl-CoA hydrolase